ncbi:MAG TPA: hypothetical protein VFA32_01030 [Dehalococcoidia bacterium]|jgi:hypothetical protein|nr:hypothetical protein [Dehalococcoidia bacterium]
MTNLKEPLQQLAAEDLNPTQQRAILALLSSPSIRSAAAAVDVDYKTLRRWLADPLFQEAFKQARREAYDQTIAFLQSVSNQAAAKLEQLLETEHPGTQLKAAVAILEFATRGIELKEIEERVEALAALVQGSRNGHR